MKLNPTQRGSTAWLRHHIPRDRIWRVIDAKDQVLGRLASHIAIILQGKHKPYYLSNMNCGDPVIVINAHDAVLTGRKATKKIYINHSGYPGGLKRRPITQVQQTRPTFPLWRAVRNMLPRNKLRAIWLDNLHIYLDDKHPHQQQNPEPMASPCPGPRIGRGGPPSNDEIEEWWIGNAVTFSHDELTTVRDNVLQRRAAHTARVGLAQLLDIGQHDALTTSDHDRYARYMQAADAQLADDAVIDPTAVSA